MRIPQPAGTKGSLKWMQRAVHRAPGLLQPATLPPLRWVSPLADDGYAEYRDAAFLDRLGLGRLSPDLAAFWPRRGPQWDGLAVFEDGVVLAEAKAHVPELGSPPSAAGPQSLIRICDAFAQVQAALGLAPRDWHRQFYQYANRLAHLWWLRDCGVNAHLVLIGFVGDDAVQGPKQATDWQAAYRRADTALGLPATVSLMPHIHHVYPDVRNLDAVTLADS